MFVYSRDLPAAEKMLWAQVLRRAVFDFVLYKGSRKHSLEWKGALQYIFLDGVKCGSGLEFSEVCGLFGWDPDYLRSMIGKLQRSDVKKMEITQLRGEFLSIDEVVPKPQTDRRMFVPLTGCLKGIRPTLVRLEKFKLAIAPLVRWSFAA